MRRLFCVKVLLISLCLSGSVQAAEDCGASTLFVSRRTIPVHTPTAIQMKVVLKDPQQIPEHLSIVSVDEKGNVLKTLGIADKTTAYRTTLTFDESKPGSLHIQVQATCSGGPAARSGSVTLYVHPADASDQLLKTISKELSAGHLNIAASYFADSSMADAIFKSYKLAQLKLLADDFRQAKFIRESDATRFYSLNRHLPDGKQHEKEIALQPNSEGRWQVAAW